MPQMRWIDDDEDFPPTALALGAGSDAPGLLAAGRRLDPAVLERAYRRGIFPWFGPGQPVLWWAPDPRMVLPAAELHITHSFAKTLRRFARDPACEIRIDHDFGRVIDACARTPRCGQGGTWIVPAMLRAYRAWHAAGGAHSFETWVGGQMVGGLYGVAIGRMFYGESMFAWASDASKIALAALVAFCRARGIALIDCQQNTAHLASLGAREVARADFERHLAKACAQPPVADWTYDRSLWAQLPPLRDPANPRSA